jgi:hypothetical protein
MRLTGECVQLLLLLLLWCFDANVSCSLFP